MCKLELCRKKLSIYGVIATVVILLTISIVSGARYIRMKDQLHLDFNKTARFYSVTAGASVAAAAAAVKSVTADDTLIATATIVNPVPIQPSATTANAETVDAVSSITAAINR